MQIPALPAIKLKDSALSSFFVKSTSVLVMLVALIHSAHAQTPGVTPTSIQLGGVLDLSDEGKERGLATKAGIEAALRNEKVQGRTINYVVMDDAFNPKKAIEATNDLIKKGIFAMVGNGSGPSVKATLPLLAENKVPAIGFPIGVNYLRPGVGDIVNFRASFAQEANLVVDTAIAAGIKPQEICAYLPNDAGGLANLDGIKTALAKYPDTASLIAKIEQIIALPGDEPDRNNIGPVGFFTRFTQLLVRPGHESLKNWEKANNTQCRLVMIVGGSNPPVTAFIQYSRYKDEKWLISVTSQIEEPTLVASLADQKIDSRVIMTQVVPSISAALPIVEEARKALGTELNNTSLEGYIVGKLVLTMLRNIKGDLTRENFLKAVHGSSFDLGGLPLDFTNDNQGSDFVQILYLEKGAFKPRTVEQMKKVFQE